MRILAFLMMLVSGTASAQSHKAGEFDYYLLALSWSPNWCALEGDARNSPQCEADADFGWVLHGLWPQYEQGWPADCQSIERNPSRADTAAMADIMGSSGSAWHQWKKHGRCSGLSSDDYYALAREAYGLVERPEVFRRLDKPIRVDADVIEEAFLKSNSQLKPDMLTVTCKKGAIQEVRICLSKALVPRICGADTRRDCTLEGAGFDPIK